MVLSEERKATSRLQQNEEKAKHKGRAVFRSQFSMGMLDFERYHKLFSELDRELIFLETGDVESLTRAFSLLSQIYRNIRHLVIDQKTVETLLKKARSNIDTLENESTPTQMRRLLTREIQDNIRALADKIYELKQMTGIGIETERVMSQKKKWERAMRISGD